MTYDRLYEQMYYGRMTEDGPKQLDSIEIRERDDRKEVLRVLRNMLKSHDVITVDQVMAKAKGVRRSMVNIIFFEYRKKDGFEVTLGEDRLPVELVRTR